MSSSSDTAPRPPYPVRVLVVDDEEAHAEAVAESLERIGCRCSRAHSGEEAIERIGRDELDLVITDLRMGRVSGLEVVEAARRDLPDAEVIVLTAYGTFEAAVEAMNRGAHTCVRKPFKLGELRAAVERVGRQQALRRENLELRRQIDKRFGFEGILGESEPMQRVFDTLRQVAPTDATVLIQGESGSGKELVAKALHYNSPRRNRRLVALNCAALSETILESELFGHEKGAFTGAVAPRQGRFEYADGGTLFLDEVGDLPLSTQIKLLRVIEEREFSRVGANQPIRVDVRLLAATNQDIEELVRAKRFREDLYFRLNVVRLDMPPLRERPTDLPILIDAFVKEFASKYSKPVRGVSPEAHRVLRRHAWPGNVRELRNCIESMVVTCRAGALEVEDLPPSIRGAEPWRDPGAQGLAGRSLEEVERDLIKQTLESASGSREETARLLGIGERTLYRKLDKYGLK